MALVEQRTAHGDEVLEAVAENVLFAWQQGVVTTLEFVERLRGAVLDPLAQRQPD